MPGRSWLTQAQTIALVAEHTVMRNRADAALVSARVRADDVGELAAQLYYVGPVCAFMVSVCHFPNVQTGSPKLDR